MVVQYSVFEKYGSHLSRKHKYVAKSFMFRAQLLNKLFILMCTWWLKSLEIHFPGVISGNLSASVSRSSLEVNELCLLSMGLLIHPRPTRVSVSASASTLFQRGFLYS